MSKSLTSQSDQILADAAAVKRRVQMGPSIGSKSRALKREHLWKKIAAIAISIGVIFVAAGVVGVSGSFRRGDLVSVLSLKGERLAQGNAP